MLCEKKYCIPGAASVHGFSLKSGQSTTVTSTVEKFLANPSWSTIATKKNKVNILIKGKGKGSVLDLISQLSTKDDFKRCLI